MMVCFMLFMFIEMTTVIFYNVSNAQQNPVRRPALAQIGRSRALTPEEWERIRSEMLIRTIKRSKSANT